MKDKPLKLTAENRPDAKVYRFPDLLDIFPKRGQVAVEKLIPAGRMDSKSIPVG